MVTATQDQKFGQKFVRSEHWAHKIFLSPWFWVLFVVYGFSYPIYRSLNRILPADLPIISTIPEFRLTDENGAPYGSQDLKGKVYLANFVFSRCPAACPKMLLETERIQKRVRSTGHKVHLVTFTVDPDYDKPKVLFELARKHKANPYMWSFLTGDNKEELLKLYRDSFKIPVEVKNPDLYDIAHSERIVLVDTLNRVRGYYEYNTDSINQLMIDVGLLINRPETKE